MIILIILVVGLFFIGILLYDNLQNAKARINQLEDIKQVQEERLNNQITTIETTLIDETKTLEEHTEEYLDSYNTALLIYVETLQFIMKNNELQYPKFIYQEITEGE